MRVFKPVDSGLSWIHRFCDLPFTVNLSRMLTLTPIWPSQLSISSYNVLNDCKDDGFWIEKLTIALVSDSQEVQKRFPDGVPLLDPIDDMGIKDPGLKKVIQKVEAFEHRMYTHPLHSDPNLDAVYTLCEKKALVSLYDVKTTIIDELWSAQCHLFSLSQALAILRRMSLKIRQYCSAF